MVTIDHDLSFEAFHFPFYGAKVQFDEVHQLFVAETLFKLLPFGFLDFLSQIGHGFNPGNY